jgi:CelD/BcsL family acetyltransferase involved in cellulose biosynthesis
MFFLRLDGRAIAFQYGLLVDRRYYLLKPAYAEDLAECSPGQLLMEEVLKDCIARELEEFDFLGPDMPWKRDWTPQTRTHNWLYVFRDHALGRTLRRAKFDWLPTLKRRLPGRRK